MKKRPQSKDVCEVDMPMNRQKGVTGSKDEWDKEIEGSDVSPAMQEQINEFRKRAEDLKPSAQTLEQLQEQHEINVESTKDARFEDQNILEDEAPRIGRKMHHEKFISVLRRGGVRCWYNQNPFKGIIGLRAVREGYEQLGAQYICGVKLGWTTEYDTLHYDDKGLPLNKKTIGWRSVLLMLISKGILTENQAHQLFGHPSLNRGSVIYREKLWQMRNARAQGQEMKLEE